MRFYSSALSYDDGYGCAGVWLMRGKLIQLIGWRDYESKAQKGHPHRRRDAEFII